MLLGFRCASPPPELPLQQLPQTTSDAQINNRKLNLQTATGHVLYGCLKTFSDAGGWVGGWAQQGGRQSASAMEHWQLPPPAARLSFSTACIPAPCSEQAQGRLACRLSSPGSRRSLKIRASRRREAPCGV